MRGRYTYAESRSCREHCRIAVGIGCAGVKRLQLIGPKHRDRRCHRFEESLRSRTDDGGLAASALAIFIAPTIMEWVEGSVGMRAEWDAGYIALAGLGLLLTLSQGWCAMWLRSPPR